MSNDFHFRIGKTSKNQQSRTFDIFRLATVSSFRCFSVHLRLGRVKQTQNVFSLKAQSHQKQHYFVQIDQNQSSVSDFVATVIYRLRRRCAIMSLFGKLKQRTKKKSMRTNLHYLINELAHKVNFLLI